MIEIRPNKAITFIFDALKVTIAFALIFYSTKFVYDYVLRYVMFMITNNLSADLSPLYFLLTLITLVFENFLYELGLILGFTFLYSINDKYIFKEGFVYTEEGILFTKKKEFAYEKITEIEIEKTFGDLGRIIIKVQGEKDPVKIEYIMKVEETLNEIKKETGFERRNEDKRVPEPVQVVGKPDRAVQNQDKAGN